MGTLRTIVATPHRPRLVSSLGLVLFMVLVCVIPVYSNWDSYCPQTCKCTYVSNRKVVKCDSGGYSTIPATLSPEVQELLLPHNDVQQIDKEEFQQAQLVNLQLLDLADNKIKYVDKDAFVGLKILIELNLRNNRIDSLHPNTFSGMEKLRKLDLTGNALTRLVADQFPPLPHLQHLKLDSNSIKYAHNFAFRNLPNITSIGLANNALELVQAELFSGSSKLVSLELSNNPWNCDCRLRPFARWMSDSEFFKNINWNCFSPAKLKDAHWRDVQLDDFACVPSITVSREIVSVVVGSYSDLQCQAEGDPLPAVQWVSESRVLSNVTHIGKSSDYYVVHTDHNNTTVTSTLALGIYGDHHPSEYKCLATNSAGAAEKVIKVVVGTGDALDIIDSSGPNMLILIGILIALAVVIVLLVALVICCWCRRKSTNNPHAKINGNVTDHSNVMVVASANSVNPVGKPPRSYEKLPQKDVEMTHLVSNSADTGSLRSYEDASYSAVIKPIPYPESVARLPTLEEEGADTNKIPSLQFLASQAAPSPTLTLQSNVTQITTSHYPDLLDNARVPRTISPTQMSYQSLAYPFASPDWRFSYAQPSSDYGTSVVPGDYVRSPVAYSTPQHQRPGYITLPRRPRAPSWSGMPTISTHHVLNPLISPTVSLLPAEVMYDTLGPRTTADGTSTTDLTRPGSRAGLYEPLPPGVMNDKPASPGSLAAHYNAVAAQKYKIARPLYAGQSKPGTSQTLPRSTPNLIDDFNMPSYRPNRKPSKADAYNCQLHASEMEPLIEDPTLGIPYSPSCKHDPIVDNSSIQSVLSRDMQINNNALTEDLIGESSKTKKGTGDLINKNSRPTSPAATSLEKFKKKTVNSSPVPTPTQILSSASSHNPQSALRPSPTCTLNNNTPSVRSVSPLTNGIYSATSCPPIKTPLLSPTLSTSSSTGESGTTAKMKIPPRPPPKPSSKRLSVASLTSDSSMTDRKTSAVNGSIYLDQGPDGSEV